MQDRSDAGEDTVGADDAGGGLWAMTGEGQFESGVGD